MEFVFILLISVVLYAYFGYALILFILVSIKKFFLKSERNGSTPPLPDVTLVIPAYNELYIIDQKMKNTFQLNYPKDKLKIIWITDGSDDGSHTYIQEKYIDNPQNHNLTLYHQSKRNGKAAAINRVMNFVQTDIVIFCDANTFLNNDSILNIVKHFQNTIVGCVAGEKRVLSNDSTAGEGESFYWKYESWIKKLSSEFHSCIGAVGEIIAFKKSLFTPLPQDTILDDFVISMQIAHNGYKTVYEPNAYAEEASSENEKEEMKRKIRIAAGAFQSMFRYLNWLNFFQHPLLSFQYFSHKVLRWFFVPLCLPLIFLTNVYLFFRYPHNNWYFYLLFLQLIFYLLVLIQHYAQLPSKIFRIPYYVIMMNVAMYKGFWRYITHQQPSAWEKVKRKNIL